MAYLSLYRKYRPQTFDDVIGQQHVIRTLTNAITEDRLHHAYLFTGPRGTGKTSTARILAKAINCAQGPTATPCGTCDSCVSITAGNSLDVIELDMASHGGVDDARDLRDRAMIAPASSRKKVYILDEVHMATNAAFNALLKLIEEPPSHIIFAMATTDPQKVLPTIMSRVQRLDLRRGTAEDVGHHVERIAGFEGYSLQPDAVSAIVRAGDGSFRDTMSVLEQVLAYSDPGAEVSGDVVGGVLGQSPIERVFEAADGIANRDLAGLFTLVQGLLDHGHDLRRFTLDLVTHLRDLLVLQVAPDRPDLIETTADRRERIQEQAQRLTRDTLLRGIDLLAETLAEMRRGPARLPLELVLAKLAVPGAGIDVAGLADRVARLEVGGIAVAPTSAPPVAAAAPAPAVTAAAVPAPSAPVTTDDDDDDLIVEVPDAPALAPLLDANGLSPREQARAAANAASGRSPKPPLAARAAEPTPTPVAAPPAPPAPTPPAPTPPAPTPPNPAPANANSNAEPTDDLGRIQDRWEPILDIVKDTSRRIHAIVSVGEPSRLTNGVLSLAFEERYSGFHVDQARRGDHVEALGAAIKQSTGISVKVEAIVDGEKRRPQPPSVGSVMGDRGEETVIADPQQVADVEEAEAALPETEDEHTRRADHLLRTQLDAMPLDG